jgi:hypothetical protein
LAPLGLLAYTVARQTKEIGIRMALGATRGRVSPGWSAWDSFLARRRRSGVHDSPRAASRIFRLAGQCLASAAVALVAVAFIAVYVPTRRATRVEPVIALRAE